MLIFIGKILNYSTKLRCLGNCKKLVTLSGKIKTYGGVVLAILDFC